MQKLKVLTIGFLLFASGAVALTACENRGDRTGSPKEPAGPSERAPGGPTGPASPTTPSRP
jgi:hypothetical protein